MAESSLGPSTRWRKAISTILREKDDSGAGVTLAVSWTTLTASKFPQKKSDDIFKVLLTEQERVTNVTPAGCFLARFGVSETQDLLVSSISHWLLSGLDFKPPVHPVKGVIEDVIVQRETDRIFVLLPQMDTSGGEQNGGNDVRRDSRASTRRKIGAREVHQIVRDLVVGLYVFNEIPGLTLTTRFDQSTVCRLTTSYLDTSIGQHLIAVDYMLKCLWHGAFFDLEKRTRFTESWKERLNINSKGRPETARRIIDDFLHAGLQDVSDLQGYSSVYGKLDSKQKQPATKDCSSVSLNLTFYLSAYHQQGATWLPIPSLAVVGVINESDDKDVLEETKDNLRLFAELIQDHLANNTDICESIYALNIVAGLIPMLIGLKKQLKIPNLAYLKAPISRKYTQTERELPPLMVDSGFKNQRFFEENVYFSLHGGIQFDVETPTVQSLPEDVLSELRSSLLTFSNDDRVSLDTDESINSAPLPSIAVGSQRYDVLELRLEAFIAKACQRPIWANQLYTELTYLKFKSLPLTSSQMKEQFSRYFEDPDANMEKSLHMAASMGLSAAFHGLLRDCQANFLEAQCEQGWSLMHEAAKGNHINILGQIIQMGLNINARQFMYRFDAESEEFTASRTPLHVAARCGALQSVACLLHCNADVLLKDENGWSAIHYTAFYDQMPIIRLLLSKFDHIELPTDNCLAQTPLLLCAVSGALSTLKWLIKRGAIINVKDSRNRSIVHLATIHTRIQILKYLIEFQSNSVQIWSTLSDMLVSYNNKWRAAANKCIRILSDNSEFHKCIIMADLQTTLVHLMKKNSVSDFSEIVATLCNISQHPEVQKALADQRPIEILVSLLASDDHACAEQAAIVLGNVAIDSATKELIGMEKGIEALSKLLKSNNPNLILSALNAINVGCQDHKGNQDRSSDPGIIENVVKQLLSDNEDAKRSACSTLVTLARNHPVNQDLIVKTGALNHIRDMIATKNAVASQKRAAEVIQILTTDNVYNQRKVMEADILKPTIDLLKVMDLELKEIASQAICAMSGSGTAQRRRVARLVGTNSLINLILTKSELLACNCCPLVTALVYEDIEAQTTFMLEGGLTPLVSLLQPSNASMLLAAVLRTVASLCVGTAYTGNKKVQKELIRQNALILLLTIAEAHKDNRTLQMEALHTCACVVLHNGEYFRMLEDLKFDPGVFSEPLTDPNDDVRLLTGMALALYACNRKTNWNKLRHKICVTLDSFEYFLKSESESEQCYAAFQVAILGPLFQYEDSASCMVIGIELLAEKLNSDIEDVFILSASFVGNLAYGRPGVSAALVALGVVELMRNRLLNGGPSIRSKCASTLARLSFHRMARRKMMSSCHRHPDMYDCLLANLPKGISLSEDFIEEFERARARGLPSELVLRSTSSKRVSPK